MKTTGVNILLADDHNLFRSALRELIGKFAPDASIHDACNGIETIAILASEPIDIVLLDVQMPKMGGIETLKHIRDKGQTTKVIMLTQFDEESLIVYLLQLGANAFLPKTCDPQELDTAIRTVISVGHYYNNIVLHALEYQLAHSHAFSNLKITPREFQVLVLLKDGKSNKEVAKYLGLTKSTVESYRKGLIKKTKCKNTVDLISLAYRTGMIPK